jgi:catechol 2,3-dioxygenase-like lactoylglutathione lyase family enzyme
MSNIKYVSAVIFVKNIQVSKEFYSKIFQQEIQYDFGKNVMFKSGFSIWEVREGHEIYQKLRIGDQVKISGFELYFETEDLDKVIALIEENQIKKFHDVKEESWGQRTIRIYDPDGNIVEIGESMERFVRRLKEVMSIEEVSKKTGLSIGEIEELLSKNSE